MRIGIAGQIALGLAICTLTSISIMAGVAVWQASESQDESLRRALAIHEHVLRVEVEAEARRALSLAQSVALNTATAEALAARDRARLEEMLLPGFADLRDNHGVRQFQFHVAPATSFYRVHQPDRFDDDLSSFRHTVVDVNRDGRPRYGLEIGVAGLGMRGVVPVRYQGEQVGSVEFGLSFGQAFFDSYTANTGTLGALYLHRDNQFEAFASTLPDGLAVDQEMLDRALGQAMTVLDVGFNGTSYAMAYFPVEDFSGEVIATGVIAIDRHYVDAAMTSTFLWFLAGLVAAAGLAALVSLAYNRRLGIPLGKLASEMNRISRNDLEGHVGYAQRQDAVGDMARAVEILRTNSMERLRLEEEQKHAEARAEAQKRKAVLNVLNQLVNVAVEGNDAQNLMARMKDGFARTVHEVQGMASAVEEMGAAVAEIAQSSETATTEAAASEQSARFGREKAVEATASMDRMTHAVSAAKAEVSDLAEASSQIGTIVEQIEGIAAQTNLLALNATIEAARAGEAGRGFAVVASEVKTLANQTAAATEDIRGRIDNVRQRVDGIIAAMDESASSVEGGRDVVASLAGALDEIGTNANSVAGRMAAIAGVLAEQSSASQEVSCAASTVSDIASANLSEIDSVISMVDKLSHSLNDQVGAFSELGDLAGIVVAKNDHAMFRRRIIGAVEGRERLKEGDVPDCHECRFGKWYAHADAAIRKHPAFARIEGPHRRVHEIGKQILRLLHADRKDEAVAALRELDGASREVNQLLNDLSEQVHEGGMAAA